MSEFPEELMEEMEEDVIEPEELEDELVVRPKKVSKKSKKAKKAKASAVESKPSKSKPVKSAKAEKSSAGTSKEKVKKVQKVEVKQKKAVKAQKTQGRKPIVKRPVKKGGESPKIKGKGKKMTGAKQSLLPRTRSKVQYESGFARPTVDGEPLRSSWPSRTHARMQKGKDSTILCQRRSQSNIWKRDLISAPPDKYKDVTCMRCKSAIEASHQ